MLVARFRSTPTLAVRLVVLLLAVGGVLGACSDGESGVEFGEGEMPESVPSDFPFPSQGVIGATLVDRDNSLTEVSARIPAAVKIVAQYFDQNLANRGYVVDSSTGTDTQWDIEFQRDEVEGSITLRAGGTEITVVTMRFEGG